MERAAAIIYALVMLAWLAAFSYVVVCGMFKVGCVL